MTTSEQAKAILGEKKVFGPDEWKAFFGEKVQFDVIPEIPWSTSVIQNPEIPQPHFLFLGLERLDDKPLNLCTWYELCSGPHHPKLFVSYPYGPMDHSNPYFHPRFSDDFGRYTCKLRWYFMPVGIVNRSTNISYFSQDKMLRREYEIPNVIERVTANILYYFLNKKYLDMRYEAYTCDWVSAARNHGPITVVGDHDNGIMVGDRYFEGEQSIGVAASKNLLSQMEMERLKKAKSQRQEEIEREKAEREKEAQKRYLLRNKE